MADLMTYFSPSEWFKSLTKDKAIIAKIDKIEVRGSKEDVKALKQAMDDHVAT